MTLPMLILIVAVCGEEEAVRVEIVVSDEDVVVVGATAGLAPGSEPRKITEPGASRAGMAGFPGGRWRGRRGAEGQSQGVLLAHDGSWSYMHMPAHHQQHSRAAARHGRPGTRAGGAATLGPRACERGRRVSVI